MSAKKKNKFQRIAAIETILVLLVIASLVSLVLLWASRDVNSTMAESIRHWFGMHDPVVSEPIEVVEEPLPIELPEPEPVIEPEPEPLPVMTMAEFCKRRALWPSSLVLTMTKRLAVRYNGTEYGHMEFAEGMPIKVDTLRPNGEVLGWIGGNYLSLSIHETDFVSWVEQSYADRFELEPVVFDDLRRFNRARYPLGTERGDTDFWSEMRIWCYQNYESVGLEVAEDTLIFRWTPREDVPINYEVEAREIARQYLTLVHRFGGSCNYAACEIRDPVSDAVLGSSSVFIPRY